MPKLLLTFKGYILNKFQIKFPKLYKIYNAVKSGTSNLTKDTFVYYKVKKSLSNEDIKMLTWKEILTYNQIPKDWKKIGPVFILSVFPLMPYLILPIAYMYPQKLLSQQFWSTSQKLIYYETEYKTKYQLKVSTQKFILTNLKSYLTIDFYTEETKHNINEFLNKFNQNQSIHYNDILKLNDIFAHSNLKLNALTYTQLKDLTRLFSYPVYPIGKRLPHLVKHVYLHKRIDELLKEVDLNDIEIEHLFMLCYQRGLNPKEHENRYLIDYLNYWLEFSSKWSQFCNSNDYYSTYLYAIVLLSLNFNKFN